MNKEKFKKTFISICLVLIFMFLPIMTSGCLLSFDDDDPESLTNVFEGVKFTYYKTEKDGDYAVKVVNSVEFLEELQAQYKTLASELLFNLTANFGGGMSPESLTATKALYATLVASMVTTAPYMAALYEYPTTATLFLGDIAYPNVVASGKYRNAINKSTYGEGDYYTTWKWNADLSFLSFIGVDSSLFENLPDALFQQYLAAAFVNSESIYKMEVALAVINAGYDITKPDGMSMYSKYSNLAIYDSVSIEASLTKMFKELCCSHSGLCEGEEETALVKFILNEVIGEDVLNHDIEGDQFYRNYRRYVKEIVHNTITQKGDSEDELKYKIVGNLSIKDVGIKALEKVDDNGFFGISELLTYPGSQCYKSIIFMNKVDLKELDYIYLTFQSKYSLELKVKVSVYSKKEDKIILEKDFEPVIVHAGKYEDLQEPAEIELDIGEMYEDALLTETAISKFSNDYASYVMTDNLSISSESASLYNVTREDMSKVAQLEYTYDKSDYIMVSFESSGNLPFDIGFLGVSYEIPRTSK